jgi:hypothetical protein
MMGDGNDGARPGTVAPASASSIGDARRIVFAPQVIAACVAT